MPQLSYTTFDGAVHTHELKPGTTRIGRTPDNDLQIDELAVSSHHCEIRYDGGTLVVKDLDSVAGIYVDGQPVAEGEIKAGQVLGLGPFLVYVKDSAGPAGGPPPLPADPTPVPLADGSYSCLRHHTKRAAFQCPKCFDLACAECVTPVRRTDGTQGVRCRSCGAASEAIDWSGLAMGKKEALIGLLPHPVQQALDFWAKRRSKTKP